jgi:hypothetical protein
MRRDTSSELGSQMPQAGSSGRLLVPLGIATTFFTVGHGIVIEILPMKGSDMPTVFLPTATCAMTQRVYFPSFSPYFAMAPRMGTAKEALKNWHTELPHPNRLQMILRRPLAPIPIT